MYVIPEKLNNSVGEIVEIGGFVHTIRDHGGLIFIDLRGQNDIMQCVISSEDDLKNFDLAQTIRPEFVLQISGKVQYRNEDTINEKLPTGKIELVIEKLEIVSKAKTPPFDIHAEDKNLANEEIRLKYRYLDMRREKLKNLIIKRHKLTLAIRNWFNKEGFIEVQTPILANSSPEGSRDYLVPSRLHPGKFYALPQAPQQFKQLLMVGGFDKYFQIAPCFRDEDPRADRAVGDFYQLDIEMAWARQEDIFRMYEKFVCEVLTNPELTDKKIVDSVFPRIRFAEAMDKYGSDKPDLRFGLAWQSAKDIFKGSDFKAFAELCESENARVQGLLIKGGVDKFTRSDLDKIQDIGRSHGLPGIAYIQYFADEEKSPIFKFFGDDSAQEAKKTQIREYFQVDKGDLLLFVANSDKEVVFKAQHQIRIHIAKKLDLIDQSILKFVWIYDFPFFEYDDKEGKLNFLHNPFSTWQEDEGLTKRETLDKYANENRLTELTAIQYDITCNGYELSSGGERNNSPADLIAAFGYVGYSEQEVRSKFSHMIEAYEYGAPYHAGFAPGIDRTLMVLTGETSIREVIAFPLNGSAIDLMTGSPSEVTPQQLKELGISVKS